MYISAPEVLDPKAKFRPSDLLPWALNRLPRGPSPLAQSDVQTYAKVQEEQNNTCITKLGSGQNRQGFVSTWLTPYQTIQSSKFWQTRKF